MDDFLITDPALLRTLEDPKGARATDEKLLVRQDGDSIDIALYLDPQLVGRLEQDDPTRLLHDGNVIDFCVALEGVSHFLYLTWNAILNRSITHLELEMQAEVDKYVAIATLVGKQRRGRIPARLHRWLFENPAFDQALREEELERYREANHYAGKYCFQLEHRYLRPQRRTGASMIGELRQFYRLTLRDKIRRIERQA